MPKPRAVRTTKAAAGAVAVQLAIGQHVLLADTSAENGGDDLGPDPHELLDAALASCTALTVTLYARRKGMKLANIEVEIDHDESGGVYRIRREVRLAGTAKPLEELTRLWSEPVSSYGLSGTSRSRRGWSTDTAAPLFSGRRIEPVTGPWVRPARRMCAPEAAFHHWPPRPRSSALTNPSKRGCAIFRWRRGAGRRARALPGRCV
jgi:putative redox protein